MEPDLDKLIAKMSEANEQVSKAFIAQSIAYNNLSNHLRELRENQPTLFTQDQEH